MRKPRTVEVLRVMSKREEVMTKLFDGIRDRRTLKDELDQSRSTVYRALEELADAGLVSETSGAYEPTMFGRLAFGEYRQCTKQIEKFSDAVRMIRSIEAVGELPESVVVESELIPANRPNPMAAVQPIHDTFREATEVRGLSPVVRPRCLELLYEQLEEGNLQADIVLEREVLSHIEPRWRRRFEPYLEPDKLSVGLTDRTLPFGLVLGDTPEPVAHFTIYDTGGRLEGVASSESEEVIDWARETFQVARDESISVTTLEVGDHRVDESANP